MQSTKYMAAAFIIYCSLRKSGLNNIKGGLLGQIPKPGSIGRKYMCAMCLGISTPQKPYTPGMLTKTPYSPPIPPGMPKYTPLPPGLPGLPGIGYIMHCSGYI